MNKFFFSKAWFLNLLCFFFFVGSSHASGLQISPVRLFFNSKTKVVAFSIRNLTEQPVLLQTSIKKWQQKNQKEIYFSQSELLVAPPIVQIKPGERQTFRVALRKVLSALKEEQTYRLFLQEVITEKQKKQRGLHFAVRVGLPIFIEPQIIEPTKLSWKLQKSSTGFALTATNLTNHHVQITKISVGADDHGQMVVDKKVFQYLLANRSYTWRLSKKDFKSSHKKGELKIIKVVTDFGVLKFPLAIS